MRRNENYDILSYGIQEQDKGQFEIKLINTLFEQHFRPECKKKDAAQWGVCNNVQRQLRRLKCETKSPQNSQKFKKKNCLEIKYFFRICNVPNQQ